GRPPTTSPPLLNATPLFPNAPGKPTPATAADAIYAALLDPALDVRSCNDPAHPLAGEPFCGETNTQSLASNLASDTCLGVVTTSGPASLHRFVQIEQESRELVDLDGWSARVAPAINTASPVGPP